MHTEELRRGLSSTAVWRAKRRSEEELQYLSDGTQDILVGLSCWESVASPCHSFSKSQGLWRRGRSITPSAPPLRRQPLRPSLPPRSPRSPPSRHRHSPHSRHTFLPRHGHWLRCQRRLLCPRAGACALVGSYIRLRRNFTCRFKCGFGCRAWVFESPRSRGQLGLNHPDHVLRSFRISPSPSISSCVQCATILLQRCIERQTEFSRGSDCFQ